VRQVLLNLVKNAREASPDGGVIEVELRKDSDDVVLRIHNQGEPLSREVMAHAFDFFYTTKARGTGLGLGLVKRVVEEHGGTVELTSAESGVSVEIRFPMACVAG